MIGEKAALLIASALKGNAMPLTWAQTPALSCTESYVSA
jgi:hypothetical protein